MSNEIKFNVKEKSVNEFFSKNLILQLGENTDRLMDRNPYYFIKDIIYLSNKLGLRKGDNLKIELYDKGQFSGKDLINTYYYEAVTYDDVSTEMVLVHFETTIK